MPALGCVDRMLVQRSNVSVVIPSISQSVATLQSVPRDVEALVISEGNRSQARNKGARLAKGNLIVFCDDDISFSEDIFWKYVQQKKNGEILGLEDFDFGLLITRFMVVSKSDFEKVGGFDETLTDLEDTDFCMRAKNAGLSIVALPRDSVSHFSHPVRIGNWKKRIFYLRMFSRHGFRFLPLFLRMARKKIQS